MNDAERKELLDHPLLAAARLDHEVTRALPRDLRHQRLEVGRQISEVGVLAVLVLVSSGPADKERADLRRGIRVVAARLR